MISDDTNKASGEQTNINTEGGPALTGNKIENSPIMTGGTILGDMTGQKIVYEAVSLAPALHQLRAPVADFVGREREIDQLMQALSKAAASGTAAAISGVRGMGGIGKTELAYAVAQRLAEHFPDAQLIVELRGASSSPLTPEQALQTVIRAFEREAKLPDDLAQLKGVYNSVLAGKRVLILADDAKDATQVRPILPPPGCALLITSRSHFPLPGMATLDLRTLPVEEAVMLLLEICPRIGEHANELARLCGYLPKALRVSANLLATRTSRRITDYLQQLSDERRKLAQLRDPSDPELDVEASLQLSYDALEDAAQLALCQVSIFPTSFEDEAARNVVEVPTGNEVDGVLEDLCLLSLLDYDETLERYSLHELVRAFAAARLADATMVRLRHARHYAQVANHAQFKLYLNGNALAGLRLFDRERIHIDAGWMWAMEHAGDPDADALLLNYPNALYAMADLRYDLRSERIAHLEAQLAAARRLGRRDHEAYALNNLGLAYKNLGDARKAVEFYEQALLIHREVGDRRGKGAALNNLGLAYHNLGDTHKAIEYYEQALLINREVGARGSEGRTLMNLGNAYKDLGDAHKAIEFHEQALLIQREVGDRSNEGLTLMNLGNAYANLGDAHKAIEFYEQALLIQRELGNRRSEALANWNLGLALAQQGDLAQAAELMQVYVDFLSELGHPDAEQRQAYLEQLCQRLAASQGKPPAEKAEEE